MKSFKKQLIIEEQIKLINAKIQQLERKLANIEVESLKSIAELNFIYLSELEISNLNSNYDINIDGEVFRGNTSNKDRFFEKLKNADTIYCYLRNRNGPATIKEIATVFGRKPNYFEREDAIKAIEKMKSKIQERTIGIRERKARNKSAIFTSINYKNEFKGCIF